VISALKSYLQVLWAGYSHYIFCRTLQTSVANTRNSNNFCTYLETTNYLIKLTPCGRALPEKVTGPQLVNKLSTLPRLQRFITAFTKVCHLSLSEPGHSNAYPNLNIILPRRLGRSNGLFP
jgi:hypothetical protein